MQNTRLNAFRNCKLCHTLYDTRTEQNAENIIRYNQILCNFNSLPFVNGNGRNCHFVQYLLRICGEDFPILLKRSARFNIMPHTHLKVPNGNKLKNAYHSSLKIPQFSTYFRLKFMPNQLIFP